MATESHKRLALGIIDFLSSSLKDGTLQPEDADSIEIASNCIAECFHVDPTDKAATKEALGDQNLLKIYSVYEKLKGKAAPAAATSSSSASAPKAAPSKESLEIKGHPTEESEKLKGQGNAAMQKKDYNRAIDFYTQALDISPLNPIYLSNRAAAYSASNQHEAAMLDAELATSTDPKYTKAWSRLGLAKFAMGDAKGSMEAYKNGIDAEGNGGSDAMKKGYETAKRKVEEEGDDEDDDDIGAPDSTARGAPGAGGMPDLSALACMFGGAGGAGGGGGMPDLSALAGMMGGGGAGGGGMPDIGAMMQNPMMRQMAQQVMQNPEMLSGLMSRFGGGGAGAGAGGEAGAGRGGGMPDISAMMNDPAIAEMARNFMGGAGGAGRGAGRGAGGN